VGTAEPWHIWLDNPELADAVAWTVALIFWPETT
jgi:exo-beta-1,3-glucanase (GH17 family)